MLCAVQQREYLVHVALSYGTQLWNALTRLYPMCEDLEVVLAHRARSTGEIAKVGMVSQAHATQEVNRVAHDRERLQAAAREECTHFREDSVHNGLHW